MRTIRRRGDPAAGAGHRRVRGEIQALRAVAVALVVADHVAPGSVPGGFVGVDVFFVISGFLITDHLLREAARTGRVDLVRFWSDRVRRILPAALVMTTAVVAAATLLLPAGEAAGIAREAAFAAISGSNWYFAATSVDYQAMDPASSPFLHTWSLGVEEQFYMVWPLVVLAGVGLAVLLRRRGVGLRAAAAVPFALVVLSSLAFSIGFTAVGAQAAYFVTPARMWELAIGGLLAAVLPDARARPALRGAVSVAGLAAIGLAAAWFTAATPMPGAAALLPVLGAAAVIAGGDVPGLRRALGARPLQWLGGVSYSLYLWHWPLLVFGQRLRLLAPGLLGVAEVVAAALLLAAVSTRFVERPVRGWARARRRPARTVLAGLAACALVVGLAAVPQVAEAQRSAAAAAGAARASAHARARLGWGSLATGATWATTPHVPVPAPERVGGDIPDGRCTTSPLDTVSHRCVVGDTASTTTIAFVGDSHAFQWLDALDALGQREHWRIETVLHNSCPFDLHPRPFERSGYSHCTASVRQALPSLRGARVVLVSGYRKSYDGDEAAGVAGYVRTWQRIRALGASVVAIGDTPTPPAEPLTRDCAAGPEPQRCGMSRASGVAAPDPLAAAAALDPRTPFLDVTDAFCGSAWCRGVLGNVIVYRDDNHVSDTYLKTTLPWLEQHLAPLVRARLTPPAS